MPDALLILNAGSSSLKFTLFLVNERPEVFLRGQVDGLSTQPRFAVFDAHGNLVEEISSDMRALLSSTDASAAEAVDLFIYRIHREIGSLAAALGGLDAIVFTGGIGENAPSIRERVCRAAGWLGVAMDGPANRAGETLISSAASRVAVGVIPTNEELVIARHALRILNISPESTSAPRLPN